MDCRPFRIWPAAPSGWRSAYTPRCRGSSRAAIRVMIATVARPLAAFRSVPGGSTSAIRNGSPMRTVIVCRGNGEGSFWPFFQTESELLTPMGTIAAPVRSASIASPSFASCSSPVGLRVPSGKASRTYPCSRILVARRNASTSAESRLTGCTPPCAASQPNTGQSNSSRLPSQWMRRRRSAGVIQAPGDHRIKVGDVVDREDHRPADRDVLQPLDLDPGESARPDP